MKNLFFTFIVLGLFATTLSAQKSPKEFLGYEPGTTRCTPHHRIMAYFEYLAAQFPKQLKLQQYGTSYENRPLVLAIVASETNFSRIEDLRTDHLKSLGLQEGTPSAPTVPIAWMSYNIHGNENVSSEAAMVVLYDLLKGNEQAVLKNTVVVIDPCLNPDGYDRYVNGFNGRLGATPNPYPMAIEHNEGWPGGRSNHYWYDLNRDWAWLVQRESQARNTAYQQWMPHIFADFHEQGIESPYFFAPPAKPLHQDVTAWQREFVGIIGDFNKRVFDKNGWLYFTKESFDLFYPSYGDTYPTFNGAIGMTFEQAGNGRAGLAITKADGDTLTLKERIAHHVVASHATIQALSATAEKAKAELIKFYQNAKINPIGPFKGYVVKTKGDEGKVKALTAYLKKMGFQYAFADKSSSVSGAFNYQTGKNESASIETNDLIISSYQPRSTFLKVLMEPKTVLEDSLTYDITAWALPYAYNLKTYGLKDKISVSTTPSATKMAVAMPEKPYAYLIRWASQEDAHLLAHLHRAKIRLRVATKAFETEGKAFAPGTLIITRAENARLGDKFDALVREEAEESGVELIPVVSGMVTKGPDLGSNYVNQMKAPRVAMLMGEGTSVYAAGEVWHYFDRTLHYPVTLVSTGDFNNIKLADFDVLVMPNGFYGRVLNESILGKIRTWIQGGGRLIAMENAVSALSGKDGFDIKTKEEDKKKEDKSSDSDLKIYGDQEREASNADTPGAVFDFVMDSTHPLGYGYNNKYQGLVLSATEYAYLKNGWNVGHIKKGESLSGFVGKDACKKIENSLMYGVQDMGRGQVIYMVNNPLFRGFWYAGKLVFANAVFMVGQ